MSSQRNGVVGLLKTRMGSQNVDSGSLIVLHCIIHQEALCAKTINFQHMTNIFVKAVNFIRSRDLNHRELQQLMADIDAENKEWKCDLAFLVDITNHLSALNLRLQGKDQLINEMFSLIKVFQIKLRLWESQIRNQNPAHFPTLKNHDTSNLQYHKYDDKLAVLREEFSERFGDLKNHSQAIEVFASPSSVDVTAISEDMQIEIIELQCNDELRKKFDDSSVYQFYKKHVLATVYPKLSAHARKFMAVFESTNVCEQLFSKMNRVKNKYRSSFTDEHLESILRIATSPIQPDIDELVSQM
ncbi:general transcription factor II-I repeat domain-containing protein 2B-like [Oratosquilla oratoria]|uniref:general transcription factor II-I repeat domain-containing protein 2B-like n=1 Tax=Oratosquilla oratoria TaxID=337810 RepID=UPI003F762DF7